MDLSSPFFVLAHNIRSLHNVGSIFRTADVFAVDTLFLCGYTGKPPDPKIAKVSLGADHTVPWEYARSPARLISRLKKKFPQLTVVGLENNFASAAIGHRPVVLVPQLHARYPLILVLGEEVSGIPKNVLKLCDKFLEIPQYGTKESLNVSVAFGIAAYAIRTGGKPARDV